MLSLIWQLGDEVLRSDTISGALSFSVVFPGQFSDAKLVSVSSSARVDQTFQTLRNVKLYLTGDADDLHDVQETWPYIGDAYTPAQPERNGGLDISFDRGRTYQRFSTTIGYESDPGTWITLPAEAIGLNGQAGTLGPFDMAHITLRYCIPPSADRYKVLNVQLALDFDIA